jgi:two-component system CheB/CheR fusion protein
VRAFPNGTLGKRAERLVERYAPAYVVADSEYQVLNFSGRTGPFLDPEQRRSQPQPAESRAPRPAAGPARGPPARRHGPQARARRAPADGCGGGGPPRRPDGGAAGGVAAGADELRGGVPRLRPGGERRPDEAVRDPTILRDEHVARLEGELRVTKDRLQATIEELESTNEELKSSNEEYQSINEEMQSANEELETSKEELQSVNEELQTVNGELALRVSELSRANSDLKNLLESTQIATLFLDNNLQVKGFTPSMSEVFHLIDSDQGRPITHIASRVPYPEMADDLRRVLRTLTTVEREIGSDGRNRYLVRVLPYRSVDNFIAGAVLTFLDITSATRTQEALRVSEERVRLATSAARIVTWDLDLSTREFTHSEGFERIFGFPPPHTLGALLTFVHADDREALAKAFDRAIEGNEALDAETRLIVHGKDLWVRFGGARAGDHLLGVFQDVDERRRAQGQQYLLMAELQHRVKNILSVVRSITRRSLDGAENLDELRRQLGGRIDALARTQGVLANRGVEGVRLDELVHDELAASQDGARPVDIEGPGVVLKDKAAETFALALHELTTNAVKYGALSPHGGRLSVRWWITNTRHGPRLALEWLEQGVAMPTSPPARSGFGRRLIERGLPYDLDAATSFEFRQDGVRCTVELPIGARVLLVEPGQERPMPDEEAR